MSLAALLRSSTDWSRATAHPFLLAVREGSLASGAFDTWLVQDHHIVSDLLWFQARLLARAPRPARAVLAAGTTALVHELEWFETVAAHQGLRLGGQREPATKAYADLLVRLDDAPVDQAVLALWAIEQAYLDAWSFAAPGAPAYRSFVEHWTTPDFVAYVDELQAVADSLGSDPHQAERVISEVAVAEARFWDMALSGQT